jgi:hypothetical protein
VDPRGGTRSTGSFIHASVSWISDETTRALKRVIDRNMSSDESMNEGELGIRISLGTYKLFHESGKEWSMMRSRELEEERMLGDRAKQREEDRRRRLVSVLL